MSRARFLPSRRTLLLAVLLAGVIGGTWWWVKPPPEPVYRGRPLSRWLVDMGENVYRFDAGETVIRAVGPPAVKWLAYKVEHGRRYEEPSKRSTIQRMWERLLHLHPYVGIDERLAAAELLEEFGPEAAPAIPALAKAIDTGDLVFGSACARALHCIGPKSWTVVQERISHGNIATRASLISTLSARVVRPHGEIVYDEMGRISEIVAQACQDPAPKIRLAAADAYLDLVANIGEDPPIRLPTASVIRLLGDPDWVIREAAVSALRLPNSAGDRSLHVLIRLLWNGLPANRIVAAETLAALNLARARVRGAPETAFTVDADVFEYDWKESADALLEMTHDPDPECREAAKRALRALGVAAPE